MSYGGAAAGLAAMLLALKRRQLIGAFDRVGATSPETARRREELGIRDGRLFRREVRRGVLRAADSGYYLDRGTLENVRRRRLAVLAIVVLVALVVLTFMLSGSR